MKKVYARECERNHWFVKSLLHICEYRLAIGKPYTINESLSGRQSYLFIDDDGNPENGGSVPQLHMKIFQDYAIDAAYLDAKFEEKAAKALDAVLELQHLRDSLLEYTEDSMFMSAASLQEGFAEYAISEAKECRGSLEELYYYCTGSELKDHRLR